LTIFTRAPERKESITDAPLNERRKGKRKRERERTNHAIMREWESMKVGAE